MSVPSWRTSLLRGLAIGAGAALLVWGAMLAWLLFGRGAALAPDLAAAGTASPAQAFASPTPVRVTLHTELPQPEVLRLAERAYLENRFADVKDTLLPGLGSLQTPEDRAHAYQLLGDAEVQQGHYQLAAGYYEGLYQNAPDVEALYLLARTYDLGGDLEAAYQKYRLLSEQYAALPEADRQAIDGRLEHLRAILATRGKAPTFTPRPPIYTPTLAATQPAFVPQTPAGTPNLPAALPTLKPLAPGATPDPSTSPTPPDAYAYSGLPAEQLYERIRQGQNDEEVFSNLSELIEIQPEARLFYWRAYVYLDFSQTQQAIVDYEYSLDMAREDINQAIALSDGQDAALYYLRFLIYERLANHQYLRADHDLLAGYALENLRLVAALAGPPDNEYPDIERDIALRYFLLHRCDEGLAVLQSILDARRPSAPPDARLHYLEAQYHVCQGDLEHALDPVNQAIAIQPLPEYIWLRAVILYQLDRHEEALQDLDGLIEAQPYGDGNRYYLRGLVQLALGRPEQAQADLEQGESNTFMQSQLFAYLQALLARRRGDMEAEGAALQEALDSLPWQYPVLLERTRADLVQRGALLPSPAPNFDPASFAPLPTPAPTATR